MEPDHDYPPAAPRLIIFWAMLGGLLSTAALVVLYYLLPLDQPFGAGSAVRVLIGLAVFAAMAVWQIRSIISSRYPAVKAFQAVGLILPFYILLFSSTYFVMERTSAASFTEPMTRTDALYFSVTVLSTVGFGDITPKSEVARIVLIVQMLGDFVLVGVGVRLLLLAVNRGRQRRSDTDELTPRG
jgi:hypothetical protein